jgi:hypothetical protein
MLLPRLQVFTPVLAIGGEGQEKTGAVSSKESATVTKIQKVRVDERVLPEGDVREMRGGCGQRPTTWLSCVTMKGLIPHDSAPNPLACFGSNLVANCAEYAVFASLSGYQTLKNQ